MQRSGPEAPDRCNALTGEIGDKEVGIEIGGSGVSDQADRLAAGMSS